MVEPIRWGVLGTANIALKRFIPAVVGSRNGIVVAIASRDVVRARESAGRLGIAKAYGSYEALLADPDVDAVYNPLPNSLHAEWTLHAAEAGKPVLCEKPLALDSAQARHMIAGCRTRGVTLMEAFMYRFHPQHARVRTLLGEGAIGELRVVRADFTFLLEPFRRDNVRLQHSLGGGALMDVGCYAINAMRMIFGEEPRWASAQWDFREEFGVEVAATAVLGFSDHRMGTFDCGFRAAGQGSYTVVGTKGQIDVLNAFVPGEADVSVLVTTGSERRDERIAGVNQYRLEAEEFADALLQQRAPAMSPDDALGTLKAIEALRASARDGGLRHDVEPSDR